jgi:predicted RNase H-like nuclease
VYHPPTEEQFASALREHERAKIGKAARVLANVTPGGMSKQALELVPAMASALKLKARFPSQVYESHPEVVFTALAKGKVPSGKTSLFGALARAGVLAERLGRDVLSLVLDMESRGSCPADNWLDALSMLVVAADWATGKRKLLKSKDGSVQAWVDEADRMIALPWTNRERPPEGKLSLEEAVRWVALARRGSPQH